MIDPTEVLPAQKWPPVTVPQAHAICAMTDPVLRNLRITQGYHDLKIALTRLFGARNVTWCAYATWASKTAGRFIRGEEVPDRIRGYRSGADPIPEVIAHVMRDVSANVAHGNLIVFQELAPLYAAWLETFQPRPTVPDATQIDAFVADHLTPGPIDQGGQDLLIQAFRTYHDAMFETDGRQKAQQILCANALVGYHEQIRLQGAIVGALDAPLVDLLGDTRARPGRFHRVIEPIVHEMLHPLARRIEHEWQAMSTRWLISSALPDLVLHVGKDVVPLSPTQTFPDELACATFEPLVALLAELDRTPDSVVGSAAHDWGVLADRMNFIVDFFRTRQQDASLYRQPFTDEQVAALIAGTLPSGPL